MVATLSTVLLDVIVVLGVAAALLAGLAVLNLGLLLPGLLAWPDGRHAHVDDGFLEPGPGAPPVISEPARPRSPRVADGPTRPAVARA